MKMEMELRRKADRAWEMAGLARQDGDETEEVRYTAQARELEAEIQSLKPPRPLLKIVRPVCPSCGRTNNNPEGFLLKLLRCGSCGQSLEEK